METALAPRTVKFGERADRVHPARDKVCVIWHHDSLSLSVVEVLVIGGTRIVPGVRDPGEWEFFSAQAHLVNP